MYNISANPLSPGLSPVCFCRLALDLDTIDTRSVKLTMRRIINTTTANNNSNNNNMSRGDFSLNDGGVDACVVNVDLILSRLMRSHSVEEVRNTYSFEYYPELNLD